MLKKTVLGIAAAATIAAATAVAPTTASAGNLHVGVGFYGSTFGVGYYKYGHRRYRRRCHFHWKKVWTYYGPRYVKVRHCRRHRRHRYYY